MYTSTVVLFLLPLAIVAIAWGVALRSGETRPSRDWRTYCLRMELIAATIATFTGLSFWLLWTHSGGSPHGLMPPSGLWFPIREIAKWSVIATVILGAFAKGKGRLLAIGSAFSIVLVSFLLAGIEMIIE
jgi:hypothetical protein